MIHTPNRYDSLDYLRGLMALAVLIFHYDKWVSGYWDAQAPQGRLGVYAVSIFFVLSGMTLTLAYSGRIKWTVESWLQFYQKRFWRIFPLLWLVTGISLFLDGFQRPISDILLNVTGLFGWINPSRDIATGAWSIGCELVYYAFFPAILLVSDGRKWFLPVIFALSAIWAGYIAFKGYRLPDPGQNVWWPVYVQPLNHALFFIAGIWIGHTRCSNTLFCRLLFAGASATFFLWPIATDPFSLVFGWDRVLLSIFTLLLVASYTYANIHVEEKLAGFLRWLGLISYSLYLWHPIVYRAVQFGFKRLQWESDLWKVAAASILSLVVSYLSFRYFERPFQDKFRFKPAPEMPS